MKEFFGSTVGPVANRVAFAKYALPDGSIMTCPQNDSGRPNTLHGGPRGLHTKVWDFEELHDDSYDAGVTFSVSSNLADDGFPGTLRVSATYALKGSNLHIVYKANTDTATPCTLTNHTYWNLDGSDSILDHTLHLNSSTYFPVDDNLIPTCKDGEDVGAFKAMNFRSKGGKRIGRDINKVQYDHSYTIDRGESEENKLVHVGTLFGLESGISMSVSSTMPSVQF